MDADAPRVAIIGASGRMGQAVLNAMESSDVSLKLAAAIVPSHHIERMTAALPGVPVAMDPDWQHVDLVIDFSSPVALMSYLPAIRDAGCALLTGTTGFNEAEFTHLKEAAQDCAIVHADNTSLGIQVLRIAVEQVARNLPENTDISVFESHHRHKKDAPSGTANLLLNAIQTVRPDTHIITSAAEKNEDYNAIEVLSERAGKTVGAHEIRFRFGDEVIRLEHEALDRSVFARGALTLAVAVSQKPKGWYSVADLLLKKP